MKALQVFTILVLYSCFSFTLGYAKESFIKKLVENDYDVNEKPDGPLTVTAQVYVRSISQLDTMKGQMESQITLRLRWTDPRLAHSHEDFLTINNEKLIWIPDVFFRNEVEAREHGLVAPNTYVRIYQNGQVLLSKRITLRTECPMDLFSYPHDSQTCMFDMASWGWQKEDLTLTWDESSPFLMSSSIGGSIKFTITNTSTREITASTSTGQYSMISASIEFQRLSAEIVAYLYPPTVMLCLLAGLSCWMSPLVYTTPRILLGLCCLLPIIMSSLLVNFSITPATPYVKAIDVWHFFSCFVVFLSIVETAFVATLTPNCKVMDNTHADTNVLRRFARLEMADKVDWLFRLVYPAMLVVFYVSYGVRYA